MSDSTATPSPTPAHPRLVFRISPISLLAVVFLVVCITPVAFGGIPGLQALYLIPVALLVWIWRTRTVADATGLSVRTVAQSRHITWDELTGLRLIGRRRRPSVRAVLTDGAEVGLPEVRVRHLALLSEISGGRVPDPTKRADEHPSDE